MEKNTIKIVLQLFLLTFGPLCRGVLLAAQNTDFSAGSGRGRWPLTGRSRGDGEQQQAGPWCGCVISSWGSLLGEVRGPMRRRIEGSCGG